MSEENDAKVLNSVQDRFEVNITELPDEIEVTSYSKSFGQWGLSLFVVLVTVEQM